MANIEKIKISGTTYEVSDATARKYENILLSNYANIANITITTDSTKGVSPYNTSYGYTNITVDTTKVALTEADLVNGTIIGIQLSAGVNKNYRNTRIRFGDTGSWIPVYNCSSVIDGYAILKAEYYKQFIYSKGIYATGAFHMVQDTNTTYTPMSLGFGYATCSTAEATAAKTATLSSYSLVANGIVAVKFTYAVGASATLNISGKGAKPIYFKGLAITAGVIDAGDIATFIYNGTQYCLLTIDRAEYTVAEVQSACSTAWAP